MARGHRTRLVRPGAALVLGIAAVASIGCGQTRHREEPVPATRGGTALSRAEEPAPRAPFVDRERLIYALVDLTTGATLGSANPVALDTPVPPGSLAKIPTALAALETGILDEESGVMCRRVWTGDGRRYVCSHPDLGRPMQIADALAHSCNFFFATVATRLSGAALESAFVRLGLPAPDRAVPRHATALGLEGVRATPRALLSMIGRMTEAGEPGPRGDAIRVVARGLRRAASEGTASALGRTGLEALAKTGTAPMPGGGFQGLALAAWPPLGPDRAVVVLAPGGTGYQAAGAAAALMAEQAADEGGPDLAVGERGPNGETRVRSMTLEEYVAGAVAGEAVPGAPATALEALAITARTYAMSNRHRHDAEGFEFCDLTHCQVLRSASQMTRAAAGATRGLILRDGGRVASVFYTAACGGRTAASDEVWPTLRRPFLETRVDAPCLEADPWEAEIHAPDLVRALTAAGWVGSRLMALAVAGRTASGRVGVLNVEGLTPATISGEAFRLAIGRTLGWHLIKSAAFEVERTAGGYRFSGDGAGHGVGLCVRGSARRAAVGASVPTILQFYFPGLDIGAMPRTATPSTEVSVRLVLPPSERGRHDAVLALTERTLRELASVLGVPVPAQVEVRFHPTVEAYQRVTGRPWWSSGTTQGVRIDLIPLRFLERRGTLPATLRHELVHVLTGPTLKGRPLWVQEGAAIVLAGESSGDGDAADCPEDAAFVAARSAKDLESIYERAARCFADALSDGRRWVGVGAPAAVP